MPKIAFISHPLCLEHDTGMGHPENSQRLLAIENKVREISTSAGIDFLPAQKADDDAIVLVHDESYLIQVKNAIKDGRRVLDAGDTVISEQSLDAAYFAVGSTLYGIDLLKSTKFNRIFCAVRPPGHHAEKDRAMGFCVFNNAAIAAKYAQKNGFKNILIVDWDVHHGNGTQHIFEQDDTIFYYSMHQYPHYPGTGSESETGIGKGKGFTLNRPLQAGCTDQDYIDALQSDLQEVERKYKADLIIISAGFDAHRDDPLADMAVTENGYKEMTNIVKKYADTFAEGRILSILEGGYNLSALSGSVIEHLNSLSKH